jgi:hypothetical protein
VTVPIHHVPGRDLARTRSMTPWRHLTTGFGPHWSGRVSFGEDEQIGEAGGQLGPAARQAPQAECKSRGGRQSSGDPGQEGDRSAVTVQSRAGSWGFEAVGAVGEADGELLVAAAARFGCPPSGRCGLGECGGRWVWARGRPGCSTGARQDPPA